MNTFNSAGENDLNKKFDDQLVFNCFFVASELDMLVMMNK